MVDDSTTGNYSQEFLSTEFKGHHEMCISFTIQRIGGKEFGNNKMKEVVLVRVSISVQIS